MSGYTEKYGIPLKNAKFDFLEVPVLSPGLKFIAREALGVWTNEGVGIEIVVNAGVPKLQYFHMPRESEYDSLE